VDVKKKNKKEKGKNIVKVNVCVVFVLWMFFLFYDKTAKIKEEINILICSW